VFPDGNKWFLKFRDRRKVAAELKIGDVVERHMMNGTSQTPLGLGFQG
jgi:DNA-directed RNA polymerase III subunit RPC1